MSSSPHPSLEQARELFRAGRFAEAERIYAAVLDLSPANIEALNALGVGAMRVGDCARAIDLLARAVQLAPTEHAARLYLGMALDRSGQRDRATLQFARALNDAQAR